MWRVSPPSRPTRLLRRDVPDLDQPPALRRLSGHAADVPAHLAGPRDLLGDRDRADRALAGEDRLQPEPARLDALDPEVPLDLPPVFLRGVLGEPVAQPIEELLAVAGRSRA